MNIENKKTFQPTIKTLGLAIPGIALLGGAVFSGLAATGIIKGAAAAVAASLAATSLAIPLLVVIGGAIAGVCLIALAIAVSFQANKTPPLENLSKIKIDELPVYDDQKMEKIFYMCNTSSGRYKFKTGDSIDPPTIPEELEPIFRNKGGVVHILIKGKEVHYPKNKHYLEESHDTYLLFVYHPTTQRIQPITNNQALKYSEPHSKNLTRRYEELIEEMLQNKTEGITDNDKVVWKLFDNT